MVVGTECTVTRPRTNMWVIPAGIGPFNIYCTALGLLIEVDAVTIGHP